MLPTVFRVPPSRRPSIGEARPSGTRSRRRTRRVAGSLVATVALVVGPVQVSATASPVVTAQQVTAQQVTAQPAAELAATPPEATIGDVTPVLTFDDGATAPLSAWGSEAASTPALSTVPIDGGRALQAQLTAMPTGGWGGFTLDIDPATDWSAADGFSFRFLGTGNGGTLRYELKSGGTDAGSAQLFEATVVDDEAGWREVRVDFGSLRLKGDTDSAARFDPATAHGFAVTLSDLGAGNWQFDEFALYQRISVVEDFEGDVPLGSSTDPVGWFTWGNTDGSVQLGVNAQERADAPDNHVLSGSYQIAADGYGGFSRNLAESQDWSAYGGIRFWWYASQPTKPASPTAGADIPFEIKDGGPDGEHSELWTTTFKDNWSDEGTRWKLVEIPFDRFTLRTDFQPGTGDTLDGVLGRTDAWGFALTMPKGTAAPVGWSVDQFELYGTAVAVGGAAVSADPAVTLVDGGDAATVSVAVTTPDGEPLPADVGVSYAPGDGTAEIGTHVEDFGGSLIFPAGTASGSAQQITVATRAPDGTDVARSIVVDLTATGAADTTEDPMVVINAHGLPYQDASRPVRQRVADLMSRMSQAEKIGQMTQAERLGLQDQRDIADLRLGSLLSGGGSVPAQNTAAGWADMIDGYQRRALSTPLQIPMIYGVDAVHGHNNVVGATILPHNSGLGATRDPALVQAAAQVTATEVRATGIPWTFAPCLCVTRDERWGRSYESFSEDPALVTQLAAPSVIGLQGTDPTDISGPHEVLATIKHWAGDGGTRYEPELAGSGYPIDQGVTHAPDRRTFDRLFVDPYKPAIAAGAGSLMPSYSAVQIGGGPVVRMHENTALNTDLLKKKLKFSGFLISDWEGVNKLPGTDYADKAARSVNSGLDMVMAPYDYATFITAVTDKTAAGVVPQSRIDDAVRRILTKKFELGLFEQPLADRSQADSVGSDAHRAVARTAAAESQVLIKNTGGVLPLAKNTKIYLAGSNADDLGHQMGGWSISWQGGSGDTTTGTTIREGLEQVAPGASVTYSQDATAPTAGNDVGVVVVGEPPYAEGIGDVGNNGHSLQLSAADRAAVDTVCSALPRCVVLVVAGRPQLVTQQLGEIDALVASWLPGSEGAGVADVLFGDRPFTGRLSVSWPRSADQVPVNVGDAQYSPLFPYGWGVRTDSLRDRLSTLSLQASGVVRTKLRAALAPSLWKGDRPTNTRALLTVISAAATASDRGGASPDAGQRHSLGEALTSVIRDLVQNRVLATTGTPSPRVSALIADADHALASGDVLSAVARLLLAWKLVS